MNCYSRLTILFLPGFFILNSSIVFLSSFYLKCIMVKVKDLASLWRSNLTIGLYGNESRIWRFCREIIKLVLKRKLPIYLKATETNYKIDLKVSDSQRKRNKAIKLPDKQTRPLTYSRQRTWVTSYFRPSKFWNFGAIGIGLG